MGVVYEVEQITLGRRVALKLLPRQMVENESRRQRFEREAQTAAGLHHTNIVPIFGVGEADGHHFYVMQLIKGVGLDRILAELRGDSHGLRTTSLTESMLSDVVSRLHDFEDATGDTEPTTRETAIAPHARKTLANRNYYRNLARIGVQIGDALDYAHAAGTMHRDIKPANLLLDGSGTAWVTDFGLAKALEQSEMTRSGDVIGTLRYMAPEQLRGEFDQRSDIFSLGLTLYELATLHPAFPARDRGELVKQITDGNITRPRKANPACPHDLATIIEKACATDPRDRYATAGALRDDLQRFLEDRPIEARRVSALESTWRWCRRNRAMASLAAVALFAFVAAGVIGWVGWVTTQRALGDARAANDLADSNLRLSLAAFATLFEEVCGDDPLTLTASEDESEDYTPATARPASAESLPLLQHILDFYDRFAARNKNNDVLAWEIAIAHRRMGEIRFRLGQFEPAIAAFEESLLRLDAATPPNPGIERLERTFAQNRIGQALLGLGKFTESVRAHERALATIREGFEFETAPLAQHLELANTRNALGMALSQLDRHLDRLRRRPEGPGGRGPRGRRGPPRNGPPREPRTEGRPGRRGEQHHQASLDALQKLLARDESNAAVRFAVAHTQRLLGRSLARDDEDAATKLLDEAIATLTELCAERPDDTKFRFELAEALVEGRRTRGPGFVPRRLPESRVERLEHAERELRVLLETDPDSVAYRETLARVLQELGLGAWSDRDTESAERRLREADRLWTDLHAAFPSVPQYLHHWTDLSLALHAMLARDVDAGQAAEFAQRRLDEMLSRADVGDSRMVRRGLHDLHMELAETLDELGKHGESDELRRAARRYRPGPR